jgi:hypothetical protein
MLYQFVEAELIEQNGREAYEILRDLVAAITVSGEPGVDIDKASTLAVDALIEKARALIVAVDE